MKIALCLVLAGCVDGIAPGALGLARQIDVMPGPIAAVVPPITDRAGDVFVVTSPPDVGGAAQPGIVYAGAAHGGWSMGCPTGTGPDGAALGWIGAIDDRAWLWTHAALVQIDATGKCTTLLDRDPQSESDLRFEAVAPMVDQSISAVRAVAVVTTMTDPRAFLITIDLGRGTVLSSMPIDGGLHALASGAGGGTGAFVLGNGTASVIAFATPAAGLTGQADVSGALPAVASDLGVGDDGSLAAVLADGSILVGNRVGVHAIAAPMPATGIDRDDDGGLWLTAPGPMLAPVTGGVVGAPIAWTSAAAAQGALASGVAVLDERAGSRTASLWQAQTAIGDALMVAAHPSLPYAVGVRGWLVGDAPMDRGGISYSDIAFLPVGVTFP